MRNLVSTYTYSIVKILSLERYSGTVDNKCGSKSGSKSRYFTYNVFYRAYRSWVSDKLSNAIELGMETTYVGCLAEIGWNSSDGRVEIANHIMRYVTCVRAICNRITWLQGAPAYFWPLVIPRSHRSLCSIRLIGRISEIPMGINFLRN